MKRIAQYIITISIVLIASCQHKELCYDHFHQSNMNISYTWSDTSQSAIYPKSMSLYIYPVDSGAYTRYEFTGHTGGNIKIPWGTYRVLTINSDTRNLEYRNRESIETFEVYSPDAETMDGTDVKSSSLPRAEGTEGERMVINADSLWSDRCADTIRMVQDWKDTMKVDTLKLTPRLITKEIHIHISDVENLQYATGGMSASISGLSGGYFPYKDSLSKERVTVLTEMVPGKDGYTIEGCITTFGDSHTENIEHKLVIYAIMSDESKWFTTYDVTRNIHLQSGKSEIHLNLKGLTLPPPMFNGGGIKPEVDEWQNTDIPISM